MVANSSHQYNSGSSSEIWPQFAAGAGLSPPHFERRGWEWGTNEYEWEWVRNKGRRGGQLLLLIVIVTWQLFGGFGPGLLLSAGLTVTHSISWL